MMNSEKIIAFDFQGWPIEKLTLEEILIRLGAVYNPETNKYEIEKTENIENFPIVYDDDGMGYGVNERYVTNVENHKVFGIGIWSDVRDKNIDIYLEDEVQLGMHLFSPDDKEYELITWFGSSCNAYQLRQVSGKKLFKMVTRDDLKEWLKLMKGKKQ